MIYVWKRDRRQDGDVLRYCEGEDVPVRGPVVPGRTGCVSFVKSRHTLIISPVFGGLSLTDP